MTRDYDTQLLESVAVRRRRLREALLFGTLRNRRTFNESFGMLIAGVCAAAVLCAGTVGWSYLRTVLDKQEQEATAQQQQSANVVAPTQVPADWVGAQVTFARLRAALTRTGVPQSLYVLPEQARPKAERASSYYVIVKGQDRFSGGVVEYQQGRIAAEFPTEDEACRWLYGELVVSERPPKPLTPQAEQQGIRDGTALAGQVRTKIAQAGGASTVHPLPQGTLVDQFGQESGSVLFPFGTAFAQRGQPQSARVGTVPGVPSNYFRYRVVKPFQVTATISEPAGRFPGGGVRFTIDAGLFPQPPALPTVRWLLRNGYLERISGRGVPR